MRNNRRGFSLFEVTIVILIMGIVGAIAAPRFASSFVNSKLVSAGNQIASHIDFIRRRAVNEGRTKTFTCDATSDSYSSEVDFPDQPGSQLLVNVKEVHDAGFELVGDFDGQTTLSFDYEGTPYVGTTPLVDGSVTIAVGSQSMLIDIAAGTGKTSLVPGGS